VTRHRYPRSALVADYARAVLGLGLTLPPLLLVPMTSAVAVIFAALAVLFAVFAASTLARQLGPLELDAGGIAVAGFRSRRIDWAALQRLKLRWFAPRRDRQAGYMQLVLKGSGRRIALDSRIDDFAAIAAAAAEAAAARGLALDDSTIANLAALGIVPAGDRHPPAVSDERRGR
jgi:hypothetical protein